MVWLQYPLLLDEFLLERLPLLLLGDLVVAGASSAAPGHPTRHPVAHTAHGQYSLAVVPHRHGFQPYEGPFGAHAGATVVSFTIAEAIFA
jgi:hypothetical protein